MIIKAKRRDELLEPFYHYYDVVRSFSYKILNSGAEYIQYQTIDGDLIYTSVGKELIHDLGDESYYEFYNRVLNNKNYILTKEDYEINDLDEILLILK